MGLGLGYYLIQDDRHFDQPNATPKLSLSKLPCKLRQQQMQMLNTPPLQRSVSIPFKWEEAPGKARDTAKGGAASATARRLELPPRLHDQSASCGKMISLMSSPVTVLEGPYVGGRSLSSIACTNFSFRKGKKEEGLRCKKKMGSWRWGSFKEEKLKLGRLRKKSASNFLINSTFWGDIYTSFKQAVPWGRRQFQGTADTSMEFVGDDDH